MSLLLILDGIISTPLTPMPGAGTKKDENIRTLVDIFI
jgi:hypothetical protein